MVEDYLPNGTSLGLVQPSVKCAASYDKCPCRGAQGPLPNDFPSQGKLVGAAELRLMRDISESVWICLIL
jgi:hypothetical protein